MPRPADIVAERFVIERKVGAGGMGVVYRALDRLTGEPVALKMLLSGSRAADEERFAAEAEALAALDHPGVVRLIAYGRAGQEPFLAMEWLEGEDLTDRLARGPMRARDAALLGQRVAEALAAAHARGLVHRDIKPSNIFLLSGGEGRLKLLDFGIARSTSMAVQRLTMTGVIMGTPGYMAPEQARGTRDVDARADLFALGAVLFECFADQPAFSGEHPMAILAKLLLEEAPRLSDLRGDLPESLVDLIARLLAKDPAARPESAAAVAAELSDIVGALEAHEDLEIKPSDAAAPAAPARRTPPRPQALTASEQRLVSVIVARVAGRDELEPEERAIPEAMASMTIASMASAQTVLASPWAAAMPKIRGALAPLGARFDALLDGSAIAVISGVGSATDQAARAARCALVLGRLAPRAAIALVTGLGDVSGPLLVGQVVDRAAALLHTSSAASVRIDPVTAGLLDVRFEVASSPSGLDLLGEREIGDGARTLLGRPSPCVGRERELRTLSDVLDECVNEGVARPVLVTAPAGMGKSRLRHEMVREAKQRFPDIDVWIARCDPMSAGSALGVVASAVRTTAGVLAGEPSEAQRRKLEARVAASVPERDRARVAEFLGEIIGVPRDGGEPSALLRSARENVGVMVEQSRRAFEEFVAAECERRPVLLVVEDLHWGDVPSVGLIDATLRRLRERPFMVLALGRPEVRDIFPKIWAERGLLEIRLGELTRRAAERLVRYALGASVSEASIAQIVERAAGNAFYLEELIHAVADGRGGGGPGADAASRAGTALPETVLAMVQARIDALPPSTRRALRAASVFGETFWRGGVISLLGGASRTTLASEWLTELVEREIIDRRRDSRFSGEEELSFRHALLREGAYAMLTGADRALGHRLAGEWLENAGETNPMILAEHFERGGERARAGAYGMRAVQRALAANDLSEAIARGERSLPLVEAPEQRFRLMCYIGEALWYSGHFKASEAYADQVLELVTPGTEAWCSALAAKLVGGIQFGRVETFNAAIAALEGIVVTPENARHLCRILGLLAGVLVGAGKYELAKVYYERSDKAGELVDPRDAAGAGIWQLNRANLRLVFGGDPWGAREAALRSIESYEGAGELRFETYARVAAATACRLLGLFDEAEAEIRRVMALPDASGHFRLVGRANWVCVLTERGRYNEAIDEAAAVLDDAQGSRDKLREGVVRAALSGALLGRGDIDAAEREASLAGELLAPRPYLKLDALAALAAVRLRQGRPAEAITLANQALLLGEPSAPHPPTESLARLVLIEALTATGARAEAQAALADAREGLLARAAKIGDVDARRAFLEDVGPNARVLALAATEGSIGHEGPRADVDSTS